MATPSAGPRYKYERLNLNVDVYNSLPADTPLLRYAFDYCVR